MTAYLSSFIYRLATGVLVAQTAHITLFSPREKDILVQHSVNLLSQ